MDVYERSAMSPGLTWLAVALSGIVFLTVAVLGFLRARARTRLADKAEASVGDEARPLVENQDVVLRGTVRHLEDHDVAVKVSVTQEGSEAESSGSWTHSWTEIDRDIVVAPFLLELPSGELVRVEPPRNVDVADELDQKVLIQRDRRVLSAELVPGEKIWACGRLERGDTAIPSSAYRDVGWGWTLRASGVRMLLSAEPLGRGLRERARFHWNSAVMAAGIFAILQVSLAHFYARAAGHTTMETIKHKRHYTTTDSDGDVDHHYVIEVMHRGELEIDGGDYVRVDEGVEVPVRVGSTDNANLGSAATISFWHWVIIGGAALAFWIGYAQRRIASRPWFRRKVNESGPGRL